MVTLSSYTDAGLDPFTVDLDECNRTKRFRDPSARPDRRSAREFSHALARLVRLTLREPNLRLLLFDPWVLEDMGWPVAGEQTWAVEHPHVPDAAIWYLATEFNWMLYRLSSPTSIPLREAEDLLHSSPRFLCKAIQLQGIEVLVSPAYHAGILVHLPCFGI